MINAFWLLSEKVFRMLISFIITAKVASTLGPHDFGVIMYVQGILSIFIACASLGFDSYLIKEFSDSENISEKLSTAILIRLSFSTLVFLIYNIISYLTLENNSEFLVSFILSFTVIFQCQTVFVSYFQGVGKSKVIAASGVGTLVISSIYKVFLIINEGTIEEFALSFLMDVFLAALGLLLYIVKGSDRNLSIKKFNKKYASKIIKSAMPIALTGILISIYSRFDQWYITNQLGYDSLGIYSIALRLVEAASFVPVALSTALIPLLSKKFKNENFLRFYVSVVFISSLIVFGVLNVISPFLINVLIGVEFRGSIDLVPFLSISMILAVLGVISTNYLIQIERTVLRIPRIILGLSVNLLLNIILVNKIGLTGAAVASIAGQLFASLLGNAINAETRTFFFIQIRTILSLGIYDIYKYTKSYKENFKGYDF